MPNLFSKWIRLNFVRLLVTIKTPIKSFAVFYQPNRPRQSKITFSATTFLTFVFLNLKVTQRTKPPSLVFVVHAPSHSQLSAIQANLQAHYYDFLKSPVRFHAQILSRNCRFVRRRRNGRFENLDDGFFEKGKPRARKFNCFAR